jgi:hypothetical protein
LEGARREVGTENLAMGVMVENMSPLLPLLGLQILLLKIQNDLSSIFQRRICCISCNKWR